MGLEGPKPPEEAAGPPPVLEERSRGLGELGQEEQELPVEPRIQQPVERARYLDPGARCQLLNHRPAETVPRIRPVQAVAVRQAPEHDLYRYGSPFLPLVRWRAGGGARLAIETRAHARVSNQHPPSS